ncbi:protoglobin domain-containing protein [Tumebacillus lipolyticus]|uniref:Protoglobin domain-containing protein n=1 Tax=Tumebacillus lipolyticus TaxID=1280370 RepID=A0ABW4ZY99_9BACL
MAVHLTQGWARVFAYSGLKEEDLRILHDHQALFEASKFEIVDDFYKELIKHPALQTIVDDHSTIDRLKKTQVNYFVSLASNMIDDQYVQSRERIGLVHARIGLTPDWFMSSTNVYVSLFSRLIEGHEQENALLRAFTKRLLFDSSIILQQYDNTYRSNMEQISAEIEESMSHVSTIATQYARSAESLSQAQENISDSMKNLTNYSEEIEAVIKLVMGIANQTHLLGLNAQIESARAGEHGRGFGIVANEVRKLSEEVKRSSKDIQSAVERIIKQVAEMNEQTASTLNIATDQAAYAQQLNALIEEVEAATNEWNQQARGKKRQHSEHGVPRRV